MISFPPIMVNFSWNLRNLLFFFICGLFGLTMVGNSDAWLLAIEISVGER
jgi:hypothetical protein